MNLRTLIPLALLPLTVLGGCITFRTVDDGIARARIGETILREGVRIMPLAVAEDSRCPRGLACIQAGTVRLAAELEGVQTELALGRPISIASGRAVTLVEVYPERRADMMLYPDEYRFGFRVTR